MNKPLLILVLALAVAGAWMGWTTFRWDSAVRKFDASITYKNPEDGIEAAKRRIYLENDSYYWLSYARRMVEEGVWRIRYTTADNTPYGREVHWSQSISWAMVLAGGIGRLFGAQDWTLAMEAGAIWINPFLHFLLIFLAAYAVGKRFGVIPALLLSGLLLTLPDVLWNFMPLRPDHQTLHVAFAFGGVLLLIVAGLGWVSESTTEGQWQWWKRMGPPGAKSARLGFVSAGLFSGLGMWVGATPQLFVIGSLVGASLVLQFSLPVRDEVREDGAVWRFRPELWRLWGWTGALVSLFFYLVEYLPGPFPIRLEVNHPVYALLLAAAGEFLAGLGLWQILRKPLNGLFALRFFVAAAVGLTVVAMIIFAPDSWYQIKNPYMLRLHNFIGEFYTFSNFSKGQIFSKLWKTVGLLPFALIGAIALLGLKKWNGYFIALVGFTTLCTLALAFAAWTQVRWTAFAAVFLALQAVIFLVVLRYGKFRWMKVGIWVISIAFTAQIIFFLGDQRRYLQSAESGREFVTDMGQMVLFKRLSLLLRDEFSGRPVRILAEPNMVPSLQWFAGIPGVTSFYWENLDGLNAATGVFADDASGENARAICKERGLTHILTTKGLFVPQVFYYVKNGAMNRSESQYTLLGSVISGQNNLSWINSAPEQSFIENRVYKFHGATVKHEFLLYSITP